MSKQEIARNYIPKSAADIHKITAKDIMQAASETAKVKHDDVEEAEKTSSHYQSRSRKHEYHTCTNWF